MRSFEIFPSFISVLSVQLPVILLWMAGLYASITMKDRNPEVSQRCLIAFSLFLITALISPLTSFLPIYLNNSGWSVGQMSFVLGGFSCILNIVRAVAWGLILHAIFSQFPPASKSPDSLG